MASLSEQSHLTLTLHYLNGMRYEEIAKRWTSWADQVAQAPGAAEQTDSEASPPEPAQQWQGVLASAQEIAQLEAEALHWLAAAFAK